MVVGALLAIAASIGYGMSDVLSGMAVRRHSTAAVALWAQITGLVVLAVVAIVVRPTVVWAGVGWGAAGGALAAVAVLVFYTALQRGPTSIVAPVAGAGVVVPVVAGLISGESIGWQVGGGVGAAVAGVLVVAATGTGAGPDDSGAPDRVGRRLVRSSPARAQPVPVHDECIPQDDANSVRSAVLLSVVAALGFGGFFVVLDLATAATGSGAGSSVLVALAVQAGALLVTLLAAAGHTRACLIPSRGLLGIAGAIGLVDVGADLALVVAVTAGPLAVVGPLGSLDPVVAVALGTAVLGERLRPIQMIGIGIVLAGVLLVATG